MSKASKPYDPESSTVRQNLIAFREAAGMSQATAAEASGIALDNLRRYESGKTAAVPGTVLAALAPLYGHAMEDFMKPTPPSAKLGDRPHFFLRTLPGAHVDAKTFRKLQEMVEEANKEVRSRPKK